MKNAILIVVLVLLATTNLYALTIDAASKRNTIYGRPKTISKTFGKLPISGEYGIFININYNAEKGEIEHESLFYRLSSEIVKDDNSLYTVIEGEKIRLAEKKWYGWITVDGVKIEHSIERTTYRTVKVWVEIE